MKANYLDLYEKYIINCKPIPFKNLCIYPIKWMDSFDFLNSYDVLVIEKDNIPINEIVSMSYLKFIITLMQEEDGEIWHEKFNNIIRLCLDIDTSTDDFKININGSGAIYLSYKDIIIDERDFDEISKIIMYQNIFDYDDSYIDPEVKKSIDIFYKISNKNIVPPNLEKQKIIIMSLGFNSEEVFNMTYRESTMLLSTINDKLEYMTDKIIRCMPYIDGRKIKINHWIYNAKKDKYDEAFVDADLLKEKVNSI